MSVASVERAALVRTLRMVGPDAPTLCPGWTTRRLVAHLVARERRPDALLGIGVPRFAERRHRIEAHIANGHTWPELVDRLASGPAAYAPLRWLDRVANIHELFVHHEDVRRAAGGWTPRALDDRTVGALRRLTRFFAPVLMPGVPARVALHQSDGAVLARFGAGPEVSVTGPPGELLLFAFGRNAIHVEFAGDPEVIDAVRRTKRRF
ncbi:TIGR03085 family metal-binding protein [Mycolicibacterium gadium]|uniref:TIGR03085 family metal-binding protein n=1 Tax=Mycolicibacterium gadium TaxID=1794 RepID=A0ABT6GXG3_MYCGU|nr:TIGR03085 family metal-binding protein [Mycolicibacterium gadium]MDG5486078.1 TIGR03085 family metal-binding protein [Mycolicibacterium gadium]